jgi:hypothetical protein
MKIPIEDSFEDKLRRRGYSEETIMMMVFTRTLEKIESEENND